MKKKVLVVCVSLMLAGTLMAQGFKPSGGGVKKNNKVAELQQQIDALKLQVADLNLRVTRLETRKPKPKKAGGFKAK